MVWFMIYLSEEDFNAEHELLTVDNGGTLPRITLGNPRPGDAMFKDLNHDNKIDGDDCTFFGYGQRPEYVAGLITGFNCVCYYCWQYRYMPMTELHTTVKPMAKRLQNSRLPFSALWAIPMSRVIVLCGTGITILIV